MKSIFSKVAIAALIGTFLTLNLQAASVPTGDTTKMSKMKMDKKMNKKMDKMKMKKKDKMGKDTSGKM